ncbi:hypothetical protein [Salinicoccus halitifaciens]|nr:hypothetical protein [Salinicoccus halitifaciens]
MASFRVVRLEGPAASLMRTVWMKSGSGLKDLVIVRNSWEHVILA